MTYITLKLTNDRENTHLDGNMQQVREEESDRSGDAEDDDPLGYNDFLRCTGGGVQVHDVQSHDSHFRMNPKGLYRLT